MAAGTRCTACGGSLEPVAKADVADRLEAGTRHSYDEFSRCRDCARVYWRGAHARRIDPWAGGRVACPGRRRDRFRRQPAHQPAKWCTGPFPDPIRSVLPAVSALCR